MFEGFQLDRIAVDDAVLRVRHGGSGPALVLLHGHPRTHTTWYQVAPALADSFTVICPDLRGYGQSSKPVTDNEHTTYSKRSMAADIAQLMTALGHDQFAIAGHDRGALVAYRTALDYPERVRKLVVLDGIPLVEHLDRCDTRFATEWWHWFFFAQTENPAERIICADPETWYRAWTANSPEQLGPENHADFLAAIRNPATVHAMVEDYRAGLGPDRQADEEDRAAGRQITCPTLVLWSTKDDLEQLYGDPCEVWRPWCKSVVGHGIDSTHHVAERNPTDLVLSLRAFL